MRWIGTGSSSLIVAYDQVLKDHLYISDDELQDLITRYIKSTGEELEAKVGYPLTFTACIVYTAYKNGNIRLPKNVSTITKFELLEGDLWVEKTGLVLNTDYYMDKYRTFSELIGSKFTVNGVYKLTCTSIANPSEIIKTAAMQMIAAKFANREDGEVNTYNRSVDFLLANETYYGN